MTRLKTLMIVYYSFHHAKRRLQLVWSVAGALVWCLIPLFKLTKKIEDEIPEETRKTRSLKSDKEIVLKIDISPKGREPFISAEALLDSGANVIFIDKKWARDKKIPLTLL